MSDIVFFTNPQSRGRIVHWMLEELGEPYETRWIDYGEQMKGADYLAINPMGKVPALQHKGAVVTEVAAICTYLAAAFPERGLIPAPGSPELAAFYRWMFFAAGPLEQAVTIKSMGWDAQEDKAQTLGFGTMADTLRVAELALAGGDFICGDQFTAVDVYFGSHLMWGMMFGTIEKRTAFEDYVARVTSRPALQQADKLNQERIDSTS